MAFQPYECLHVPLKAVSPVVRLVGFWPSWLVAAAVVAVAVHEWGRWVLFVPIVVVIGAGVAVLAGDFASARRGAASGAPVRDCVVTGTAVVVAPVAAASVHVCRGCGASGTIPMITVRGESIPVCGPCQVLAVSLIQHLSTAAALEGHQRQ